jgi:hypothetical protein
MRVIGVINPTGVSDGPKLKSRLMMKLELSGLLQNDRAEFAAARS